MKITAKNLSKTRKQIDIEVTKGSLEEIRNKIVQAVAKEAKISGFRPGKAPLDLVEKTYAKTIEEKLLEEAVPAFYSEAVKKENFTPAGMPEITRVQLTQGQLTFTATVDVKPSVEIDEKVYRNITLGSAPIEVKDEEIQKVLATLKDSLKKAISDSEISDDYLARWMGYRDITECKAGITHEFWLNKFIQRRKSLETKISKVLLEAIKIELPASVLQEQKEYLLKSQFHDLRQRGVSEEEIQKHKDEIEKKCAPMAEEQLKLYYILEAIAEKEQLKLEDKSKLYDTTIGYLLSQAKE